MGDRLLFFLVYRLLRGADAGSGLRKLRFVSLNGLCRLTFPEDFTDSPPNQSAEWNLWTIGPGSAILECLQAPLAKRWVELEFHKGQLKRGAGHGLQGFVAEFARIQLFVFASRG